MAKHDEMMILPVEDRREFFRKAYALEMGRAHAAGSFKWPIEKLPDMVERAMAELLRARPVMGPAMDAVKKFFGIKTQKVLWIFLGVEKQ